MKVTISLTFDYNEPGIVDAKLRDMAHLLGLYLLNEKGIPSARSVVVEEIQQRKVL